MFRRNTGNILWKGYFNKIGNTEFSSIENKKCK